MEDFSKQKVQELLGFLQDRGIQVSEGGKRKRKEELVELCEKARAMKQVKLDDTTEDVLKVRLDKLITEEGRLPDPLNSPNLKYTYNFSDVPDFTFGDLYNYLVGKADYTGDSLRSFKSLNGFKLFRDGHVHDLAYCLQPGNSNHLFKFSVKPAERAKTDEGKSVYDGFLVLKSSGSVHSAYCTCKAGTDGACKHIAAALFDLQATICNNILVTCTSARCTWKRRHTAEDHAIKLVDLNVVKAEFGKEEKAYRKPAQFDPRCRHSNPDDLRDKLRQVLQDTCPDAVALQFLQQPVPTGISETMVYELMNNDVNIERFETVEESVSVYTMLEYGGMFLSLRKQLQDLGDINDNNVVTDFMEFISLDTSQIDAICQKTVHQGASDFWHKQRAGRITASNFYKVCHLRESTNKTNTIKLLMNCCPLTSLPVQLEWGHRKEKVAVDKYTTRLIKKHTGLEVTESGLVINPKWPYLAASPDRISTCECHGRRLVECKSLFSKRNLHPAVAANDKLLKTPQGQYSLKEETSWYYQIQGQMALTGIYCADLVIYTNKGILIVQVEFDEEFWLGMFEKLKLFFHKFLAPEILKNSRKTKSSFTCA